MEKLLVDGSQLSLEKVLQVATGAPGDPAVALSPDAHQRVQAAARAVQSLIDRGVVAYGITTGFGAFKDRLIPQDQTTALQRNILVSHAVGTGPLFDRPTTCAIMLNSRQHARPRSFRDSPRDAQPAA